MFLDLIFQKEFDSDGRLRKNAKPAMFCTANGLQERKVFLKGLNSRFFSLREIHFCNWDKSKAWGMYYNCKSFFYLFLVLSHFFISMKFGLPIPFLYYSGLKCTLWLSGLKYTQKLIISTLLTSTLQKSPLSWRSITSRDDLSGHMRGSILTCSKIMWVQPRQYYLALIMKWH